MMNVQASLPLSRQLLVLSGHRKRISSHRVPALIAGIAAVSALFAGASAQAEEAAAAVATPERPRIALVLGGGGAKGLAHVGVLEVMDQLQVPVDCIAGTSMGALVGGAYATGMSAETLSEEALGIDWQKTVGSKGGRKYVPIERKLQARTFNNPAEFGFEDGRLSGVSGLISTQDIEGTIRNLVSDARLQRDFDTLPIPFRAVATDMVSGDMVVMGSGDLSVAMRASMALPGVFSPVVEGNKVLSDGGMVRNLPVDIGRELCADVVIAVWLSTPQPGPDDLKSAAAILSRSTDVMIDANEKAQIATLTEQDIGISVPMGDIGTADFQRAADAVELGRQAALAASTALQRYSIPRSEYLAWRESVSTEQMRTVRLAGVKVVGLERVNPEYVQAQLQYLTDGAEVTLEQIEEDTGRIYALGDFSKVAYTFNGPPEARVIEIRPEEKSYGPNFFTLTAGLAGQTNGELLAILGVDHNMTWLNERGGRWHNVLQVGRQTIIASDFYQPFDTEQRFFIQPVVRYERNLQDIYQDGNRESRYYVGELFGRVDLGANIGTYAQLRGGVQSGWIDTRLDIGQSLLPDLDKERDSNIGISGVFDTRDNAGLPLSGSYLNVRATDSGSWLSGEQEYTVAEGVLAQAIPFRGNSLNLFAAGGKELAGELPVTRDFLLGGIRSFPGLWLQELRGTSYWVAGGNYRQKIADIVSLFNQSFYAGLRAQAGRIGGSRTGDTEGTLYGLSGGVSGRSPLGAFNLSLGYVTNDSWALQFAIGAPIPEGTLLDEIN